jgi:hypothetical protein
MGNPIREARDFGQFPERSGFQLKSPGGDNGTLESRTELSDRVSGETVIEA